MTETRTVGVSGIAAAASTPESRAADALKAKNAVEKMILQPVLNNAVKMINRTAKENQDNIKGK
ncbi:hypothetical protein HZC35_04425 [Candidatus Saganbacteria bacterium]|nr:hypothetical protein [Candidatus Saganbacteria bacterium]